METIKDIPKRVKVLGIPVDVINMESVLSYVNRAVQEPFQNKYILAVNPEKVFVLKKDPFLLDVFEKAHLLIPDGIGVVKAIQILYKTKTDRVAGADLMENICEQAVKSNFSIFIFGGKESTNKRCVEILEMKYPGIRIVGRSNGYLSENEYDSLLDRINGCCPDVLFVGLGSPKQEQWINQYIGKLRIKVCQGVGGTLDTIAGEVKRAPIVFRKSGFEWFYRLIKEPHRLKRQLVLPKFAFFVLIEKIKGSK